MYGGMIWYVFPDVDKSISWEGHLAGLISGFVFAIRFKTPDYVKEIRYEWEKPEFDPESDPFMRRFDENGNFVNLPIPEDPGDSEQEKQIEAAPKEIAPQPIQFFYTFRENKEDNK